MPAAAIPLITAGVGAAGAGASAAGGKKASNKANALASQQLNLQKQQFGLGNAALGGARDWYNALLHGGQAAVQATGPIASQIGQAGQGTANSIHAFTPRGGEQNLALAQNSLQTGNNISRLYAGAQPMAAAGLTGVGQAYLGSAGQPSPYAASSVYQSQIANAQGGAQGFGSLLYRALNKNQGGGGGNSGGATFPTNPAFVEG